MNGCRAAGCELPIDQVVWSIENPQLSAIFCRVSQSAEQSTDLGIASSTETITYIHRVSRKCAVCVSLHQMVQLRSSNPSQILPLSTDSNTVLLSAALHRLVTTNT